MGLESFHKPLDYDAEGRKNLEGTYSQDPDLEIGSYDLLFDQLDPFTVSLLKGEINEDDIAALKAARSESDAIAIALAESEMKEPLRATDIGRAFINIPTPDKLQAEQQERYDLQFELETSGSIFMDLPDELDLIDDELDAEFDKRAAELEGIF